jgi:hypothetical protein
MRCKLFGMEVPDNTCCACTGTAQFCEEDCLRSLDDDDRINLIGGSLENICEPRRRACHYEPCKNYIIATKLIPSLRAICNAATH